MKLMTLFMFTTTFFICCNATSQEDKIQMEFINIFISDFNTYKMDIQSAGIAKIPVATISSTGILYIEYAYTSEGENRNGNMTLSFNHDTNKFEGAWETIANTGNVYKGTLYFVFNDDGQADGYYQFSGSNYKITIFKQ